MQKLNQRESLREYITKPTGYITIITFLVTIAVTFFCTVHFRERVELTVIEKQYDFFSQNETEDIRVKRHIEVFYNEKKIDNPHIIKLTLQNSGNKAISEEMFRSETFDICVGDEVKLYDSYILSASTPSLFDDFQKKIIVNENRVSVTPFLINKNEEVTLFVVTDGKTEVEYKFRIEGISDEKHKELFSVETKLCLLIMLVATGTQIGSISSSFKGRTCKKSEVIVKICVASFILIATILSCMISIYTSSVNSEVAKFIFK